MMLACWRRGRRLCHRVLGLIRQVAVVPGHIDILSTPTRSNGHAVEGGMTASLSEMEACEHFAVVTRRWTCWWRSPDGPCTWTPFDVERHDVWLRINNAHSCDDNIDILALEHSRSDTNLRRLFRHSTSVALGTGITIILFASSHRLRVTKSVHRITRLGATSGNGDIASPHTPAPMSRHR